MKTQKQNMKIRTKGIHKLLPMFIAKLALPKVYSIYCIYVYIIRYISLYLSISLVSDVRNIPFSVISVSCAISMT